MTNFKKPTPEELKKKLTPEQFYITQQCGTEPPFQNAFWNHKEDGLYVDVVSGEPLFSSKDKFDSGTGWPSFTKPIEKENVVDKIDSSHGMTRVEVRSKNGDSHLGHVFEDGPRPTGLRFCINSSALRFIPAKELEKEGYGQYAKLFEKKSVETPKGLEKATFAAGCFWGVEEILRQISGVVDTEVGYTGGKTENPVYEQVKTGKTGHAEAIQITFDPTKVTYEELLRTFWRLHDPTTSNRQGNDIGTQYRSSVFFYNESQRLAAIKVKEEVETSGRWKAPIVTEIVAASTFYPAEDYHQDYLQKHPNGYTCHFLRD